MLELIISRDESKNHIIMLFDSKKQVFQVNTPIKSGVVKEVRRVIRLNDRIYTLKWFDCFGYSPIILSNIQSFFKTISLKISQLRNTTCIKYYVSEP
jgi:hypothetical protein